MPDKPIDIDAKLEQVRQEYLMRITRGNGALLREVESYAAARTGKMLRPRMLLSTAATLGHDAFNSRRTLLLAVAVEMLHNASLLHDDVIDNDLQRRGQPSVNARYGNATAVLVGDYLLAQLMNLLNEVDDIDASRRMNKTVLSMAEAELLAQELLNQPNNLTAKQYLTIIDGKTAQLFATAAALGNPAYEDFGLHYGRLFQLRDDIADGDNNQFTEDLIRQEEDAINALENKIAIL